MKKLFEDVRAHLLSGMTLTFNRVHSGVDTLASYKEEDIENGIRMTYEPVGGNASAVIEAKFVDDAVIFYIDAVIPRANGYSSAFAPENAVTMTLGDMQPDALLGSHHDCPWWMLPSHPATFADIKMRTQSLLVRSGAVSYHMLPLCGDNFRCEMEKGVMALTSDAPALQKLTGAFLAVSVSTDPFAAIENNYKAARSCGAIRVPLRTERKFPEIFEGFGFCTWDCFYYTITSEKLYQKLDELKEKNIPVHWVIIDDGWLSVKNAMLTSFEEDRTKFPEGFKETIRRMKEDYGVEYVGVWHAFNGYWDGVDPESKLYEEQKDNLFMTPGGFCLPSLDEEKAFRFWDAWHSYLADCGVDFLKVDNQSSNSGRLLGTIPTAEACRIAHNAIERSINKNFNGVVIDCMGMDMENVLARPSSAVSRNSDDFFPRRERGFIKHLTQNVYSAMWHGQIHHCDFDMWWSDHESSVQSGVLRAISGSPIYVSDEVCHSKLETIMPVVADDGMLMRCDGPAMPTLDCVYSDCTAEGKLLKVWNKSGDCYALAAFNVSDGDITDTVEFGSIPVFTDDGDYMAYEYFSQSWKRVNRCEDVTLTLPKDGVAIWSIYPVVHPDADSDDGAYIMAGSTTKYLPIAAKDKVKVLLSDLI